MNDVTREMPKYVCHKTVWALKIQQVKPMLIGACLIPEDTAYAEIRVDDEFMQKHNPKAGGYYVVYADGYKSFSPAAAFESGYTLLKE